MFTLITYMWYDKIGNNNEEMESPQKIVVKRRFDDFQKHIHTTVLNKGKPMLDTPDGLSLDKFQELNEIADERYPYGFVAGEYQCVGKIWFESNNVGGGLRHNIEKVEFRDKFFASSFSELIFRYFSFIVRSSLKKLSLFSKYIKWTWDRFN